LRERICIVKREIVVITSGIILSSCILTSCDTPVGQGAAWGAATGAIIAARRLVTFGLHQLVQPQGPQPAP
jgi:NAD(P)H-hydrate repair Nnr-like enzyme with NAD(P)H-hydrate epimerase domain